MQLKLKKNQKKEFKSELAIEKENFFFEIKTVEFIMSGVIIDRLLGRSNYLTWKVAAKAWLELDDLWCAVELEKNSDGVLVAAEPDKDRKARSRLTLSIDPVCFVHIQDAKTAKEIWDKLSDAFEDSGLNRRIGLLRKLISTKLSNSGSMEAYVHEIVTTAHTLSNTGFKIDEEWVAAFLLAGLQEEYRPMILALENSGMKLTGDAVKTKLLQEVHQSDEQALNAKKKPGRGPKCNKCGNFGHIARQCRTKQKNQDHGKSAFNVVLSANGKCNGDEWYFDSGATSHMTRNWNWIQNSTQGTGSVMAADGKKMNIEAVGTALLKSKCSDEMIPVHQVQYIPELSSNLLSVGQIVKKKNVMIFTENGCEVRRGSINGPVIATGSVKDDLFVFDQDKKQKAMACIRQPSMELWHRRMGHINIQSLKKLRDGCATGVNFQDDVIADCMVCPKGKQARKKFNKEGSRASELLEVVHSDICYMEEESLGGHKYFITLCDDYSRRIFVYFLKSKEAWEVKEKFNEFKRFSENQTGRRIKKLRTDNGTEYTNKSFQDLLKKEGIQHQKSNVDTPQQNGLAERDNGSIVEKARYMLLDAELPKSFWAEAVYYSVYILNRSPSQATGKTPEEQARSQTCHILEYLAVLLLHMWQKVIAESWTRSQLNASLLVSMKTRRATDFTT